MSDVLIRKLLRAIAYLLGRGAEYDAECARIDQMSPRERDEYTRTRIKQLKDQ
jgi:hypothetical protein